MKKITLIIGFFIFSISCNVNTKKQSENQEFNSKDKMTVDHRKMAFQREEFISYYDFTTKKLKNLTVGFDPCISPDSKWIAYTEQSGTGKEFSRIIRLINTENSAKKDLDINDSNHWGAIWAPTGEYIAFCIMTNHWQIGLIKPDNSDFKILTSDSDIGLLAPTWSQDGKFVFAHNWRGLYKFSTSGELIEIYDFEKLFGDKFHFISLGRFWLTSDNKTLIFGRGVDEYVEGLTEPLSFAIFSYDFDTKMIKRISKKGLCTGDLWIDKEDRIYFSGFENINEPRIIYQTSLVDTTLKVILENGSRPSIGQ